MRLRRADWRDLAAMAQIETRCFPVDAWPVSTFWAELAERPRRDYWVAVGEHDQVLGYAGLGLSADVADVMTIAVDPGHRGSGLGRRLLERLHTSARDAGVSAVLLEVREDNPTARNLYAADGYEVIQTRNRYYRSTDGSPAVDALIMRKELTS